MKNVFIVHGFEGKPNGAWRPWLMRELEKQDVYACALPMPDPYFPKRDAWVQEIARHIPQDRSQTVLVGHSLGVPAILNFLQEHPSASPFCGLVLLSGPVKRNADPTSESFKKLKSFFESPFDFEQIRKQAKSIVVIHGDNDAVVPVSHAEHLSSELGCELKIVLQGGHLNGSSGFYEMPQLLTALQSFWQSS